MVLRVSGTVEDVIKAIEKVAPPYLKYGDDPTGFQVGDRSASVDRILFCLEVNEEVIEEAADIAADMIVSHHPLVFKPVGALVASDQLSGMLMKLVKLGISVYSAHTSLDRARWGVSDALAEAIGLKDTRVLVPAEDLARFKLVVFTPVESADLVMQAISEAGAGVIGDYTHCTFRTRGIGTFKPMAGAHPQVGEVGKVNEVPEVRLEAVVPAGSLGAAISSMIASHPYEEVAYDVYRIENAEPGAGYGRVGTLAEEISLKECVTRWTQVLSTELRVAGDRDKRVNRVAVCGGSGGDLIKIVARQGVDVYVTGDVKHHAALEAKDLGVAVVDAGHHATEVVVLPGFAERIGRVLQESGIMIDLVLSKVDTDPWRSRR